MIQRMVKPVPISERVLQLPAHCSCGFKGNSSKEMEQHFKDCITYGDMVVKLIQEENA